MVWWYATFQGLATQTPAAALVEPGDLKLVYLNFVLSRTSSSLHWEFFSRPPPTILVIEMTAAALVEPGDLLNSY